MRHTTLCTLCKREVTVVRNWSRWQSGQSQEWRVSRHRATEERARKGQRETICRGTGILVYDADIIQRERVSA